VKTDSADAFVPNHATIADLLTPAEKRELAVVVRTNGGGLNTYSLGRPKLRILQRLHLMGLVQGKAGAQWRIVHTRDGLAVARAAAAPRGPIAPKEKVA
jgi:hypothetical protein